MAWGGGLAREETEAGGTWPTGTQTRKQEGSRQRMKVVTVICFELMQWVKLPLGNAPSVPAVLLSSFLLLHSGPQGRRGWSSGLSPGCRQGWKASRAHLSHQAAGQAMAAVLLTHFTAHAPEQAMGGGLGMSVQLPGRPDGVPGPGLALQAYRGSQQLEDASSVTLSLEGVNGFIKLSFICLFY